jgi:hypothetical protein
MPRRKSENVIMAGTLCHVDDATIVLVGVGRFETR